MTVHSTIVITRVHPNGIVEWDARCGFDLVGAGAAYNGGKKEAVRLAKKALRRAAVADAEIIDLTEPGENEAEE